MRLILGIDEAGYGPNLGPLVIACTAWICHSPAPVSEWAESLKPEFSNVVGRGTDAPIALGDSKLLYSSQGKLAALDRTVGFFLSRLSGENPLMLNRADLVDSLDADFHSQLDRASWLAGEIVPAEQMVAPEQIKSELREQALMKMERLGIRFLDVRLRVISEPTFNDLVAHHGNKASLLTAESIKLAKSTLSRVIARESALLMATPLDSIEIIFDKHGGRSKYAAALSQNWSEWFFKVNHEGREISSYSVYPSEIPKLFSFIAKGDHLIPCGLASIFAKWTREMLMQRLNCFWQNLLPSLQPTAGYPVDAKRFAKDIESIAAKAKLDRSQWWRIV